MNITVTNGNLSINKPKELAFLDVPEESLKKIEVFIQKFDKAREFEVIVRLTVQISDVDDSTKEWGVISSAVVAKVELSDKEVEELSENEITEEVFNKCWPLFESNLLVLKRFQIKPFELPPVPTDFKE